MRAIKTSAVIARTFRKFRSASGPVFARSCSIVIECKTAIGTTGKTAGCDDSSYPQTMPQWPRLSVASTVRRKAHYLSNNPRTNQPKRGSACWNLYISRVSLMGARNSGGKLHISDSPEYPGRPILSDAILRSSKFEKR